MSTSKPSAAEALHQYKHEDENCEEEQRENY